MSPASLTMLAPHLLRVGSSKSFPPRVGLAQPPGQKLPGTLICPHLPLLQMLSFTHSWSYQEQNSAHPLLALLPTSNNGDDVVAMMAAPFTKNSSCDRLHTKNHFIGLSSLICIISLWGRYSVILISTDEDTEAHSSGKELSCKGVHTAGKSPAQNHRSLGLNPGSAISSRVTPSKSFALSVPFSSDAHSTGLPQGTKEEWPMPDV